MLPRHPDADGQNSSLSAFVGLSEALTSNKWQMLVHPSTGVLKQLFPHPSQSLSAGSTRRLPIKKGFYCQLD